MPTDGGQTNRQIDKQTDIWQTKTNGETSKHLYGQPDIETDTHLYRHADKTFYRQDV